MKRILVCLLVSCFVIALTGPPPVRAEKWRDKMIQQWSKRLEKIHRQLEAGSWTAARRASGELADEMALRIIGGGNSSQVLARVITYRAVAYAGLGKREEALWYWQVAQNLDQNLRAGALFPEFGSAGAFLERRSLRRPGEPPADLAMPFAPPDDPKITPPVPLSVSPPRAPHGLALEGWYADRMRIEVLVDAGGRIRSPVVLEGEMPVKIYLGLEALRRWRLEPPRAAGEPVATLLSLDEFTVPRSFAFLMAENRALRGVHRSLIAGRWQEAATAAQAWSATSYRGLAAVLLALAEAGLGQVDGALEHWRQAQTLLGGLEWLDFSAYGAAGRLLEQSSVSTARDSEFTAAREPPASSGPFVVGDDVRKPIKLSAPQPQYSAGARQARTQGVVIVQAIIDRLGIVRQVKVLKGLPNGLSQQAVRAIHRWRFLPATLNGAPVDVYYNLTVNFRLR